ncbi:HU family DNA-binding protein [uncultured Bacteroides sp.]|uniref:HU family DNA-binding protein n=1 Tax=uncultured Bacteroides sp. TaxID=162156 RepID=UPI002AABC37E|nr:HU family DNA-binding protein [uncultured Bacteroides sp.]
MSVTYSVVMRKNPAKPAEAGKFYALAQSSGTMDFNALCKDVKARCTVTRADIAGVVEGVLDSMIMGLEGGKIVRLGNFGSFQLGVNGKGAATEKEFNSTLIKGTRIAFRPGPLLIEMQNNLGYSMVPKKVVKVTTNV